MVIARPLTHITDGTPPAWTVDWGYKSSHYPTRAWYAGFRTEADARDFASWYFVGCQWPAEQRPRVYPGSVRPAP